MNNNWVMQWENSNGNAWKEAQSKKWYCLLSPIIPNAWKCEVIYCWDHSCFWTWQDWVETLTHPIIWYDDGLGWLSATGWDSSKCVSIFDSYFSGYIYHNVMCYNTGIIGKIMPILIIKCIGKLSLIASYPYSTLTPPSVAVSVMLSQVCSFCYKRSHDQRPGSSLWYIKDVSGLGEGGW